MQPKEMEAKSASGHLKASFNYRHNCDASFTYRVITT